MYLSTWMCKVKIKVISRQAELAQGVPGRLRRRIILTFRHYKGGRSSAKRTGRLYSAIMVLRGLNVAWCLVQHSCRFTFSCLHEGALIIP